MGIYRLIGTQLQLAGRRELQHFGQSIDLPDDLAHELILGGGSEQGFAGASAILPDAEFKAIFDGVDEKSMAHFSVPANQYGAGTEEFLEKKTAALDALHEFRVGLEKKAEKPPPMTAEAPKEAVNG